MMYEAFAAVYDRLMDDFDYPKWADYYLRLLARNGKTPGTICECACGTGSMTVEFAARGLRVTASDLSGDMLEVARQKLFSRGVSAMLVRRDMCEMELPRPVDAVVCACDGVNYLTSDARLTAFFRRANEMLVPGGILAFDVSSAYKLRSILGNGFYGEERDDVAYLWFNHWCEERQTVSMDLTFFVREKDGRYRRFSEQHVQKAHAPEHLAELLQTCGFENVEIFGDKTLAAPGATEARLHLIARKGI